MHINFACRGTMQIPDNQHARLIGDIPNSEGA
jgi:hypothetical protein